MAGNRLISLKLQAPSGNYWLSHPDLAYATIVKVTREQTVHNLVTSTPSAGSHDVLFYPGVGKLEFDMSNPFNFVYTDETGTLIEYVHVIYKRGSDLVFEPGGPSTDP